MDDLTVSIGGLQLSSDLDRLTGAIPPPEPTQPQKPPNQSYHSFLCMDVESTCIDVEAPNLLNPTNLTRDQLAWSYPNEIIEWPVVLLQWRLADDGLWELYEAGRYRRFVKPTWKSAISKFCTDLTGITQDDVDQAMTFPQVLKDFDLNFIKPRRLFSSENRAIWVTDGPWDLRDHFPKTVFLSQMHSDRLPTYLKSPISIIDIRCLLKVFIPRLCVFDLPPSLSLIDAMAVFGLDFQGRLHSGIDDAINLGRLLSEMVVHTRQAGSMNLKWTFKPNRVFKLLPQKYFWMAKNHKCTWTLP